jgi:hypothetical protein
VDCPFCHRLLYSRSHRACGYCGRDLPEECVFSPEEIEAIDAEQAEIAARRAAMKEAEEEERRTRQRNPSSAPMFFPPMA